MYTRCLVALIDAILAPGQKLIKTIPTVMEWHRQNQRFKKASCALLMSGFEAGQKNIPLCTSVCTNIRARAGRGTGGVFTRFEAGARLAREQSRPDSRPQLPLLASLGLWSQPPLTNSLEEVHSNNMNIAGGPPSLLPALTCLHSSNLVTGV